MLNKTVLSFFLTPQFSKSKCTTFCTLVHPLFASQKGCNFAGVKNTVLKLIPPPTPVKKNKDIPLLLQNFWYHILYSLKKFNKKL